MDTLASLLAGCRDVLFLPYAGSDPDRYTVAMREALAPLGVRVDGAHKAADPGAALGAADAVFVGGGNAFRLLRAVRRNGQLTGIRDRVRDGMPYVGVSAGANLACPTIRTTNDMPIVQPDSFDALGLIPFQINPHYPMVEADSGGFAESRDKRLTEFLEENDVPVLGLCEGSWLRVSGNWAALGGDHGGRLFARGHEPRDLRPGSDLSVLLETQARYDSPDTPR